MPLFVPAADMLEIEVLPESLKSIDLKVLSARILLFLGF